MSFIRDAFDKLPDEEASVKNNKDFYGAIELAKKYIDKNDFWKVKFNQAKALGWLYEALSYQPENVELNDVINLADFFNKIDKGIYCSYLFTDIARPLLDELINCKRIQVIDLSMPEYDDFSSSFNFCNSHFANYIGKAKYLKVLKIPNTRSTSYAIKISDMDYLALGLKTNTSIRELSLRDNNIGDEGLFILLNALAENPLTKLNTLNLLQMGITDEGAKAIISFLRHNHTLELIALDSEYIKNGKNKISDQYLFEIKKLLDINKNFHNQFRQHYTRGAITGLFPQFPAGLNAEIEKCLNFSDGQNIALTSKASARAARAAVHEDFEEVVRLKK